VLEEEKERKLLRQQPSSCRQKGKGGGGGKRRNLRVCELGGKGEKGGVVMRLIEHLVSVAKKGKRTSRLEMGKKKKGGGVVNTLCAQGKKKIVNFIRSMGGWGGGGGGEGEERENLLSPTRFPEKEKKGFEGSHIPTRGKRASILIGRRGRNSMLSPRLSGKKGMHGNLYLQIKKKASPFGGGGTPYALRKGKGGKSGGLATF